MVTEFTKGDGKMLDAEVETNTSGIASFTLELGESPFNNFKISESGFPDNFVELSARSKYSYSIPPNDNDGWPVDHLEEAVNNPEKALEAVDKIRWENYNEVHSILLVVDGKLVLEHYFPGTQSDGFEKDFDRFTPHELHSASKTFRSALIGIAIDKGFVPDESTYLANIFPELSFLTQGGKENIKLEHILTMSTGLEWDETSAAPNSLSEMYTLPYADWYSYILSKPLIYDPGTTFVYNTGASLILNKILLDNAQPSILTFIEDNYSSLVESDDPYGAGYPFGASEARPREMAKLGEIYANDGKWKNTLVVPKEWVDKSIASSISATSSFDYGYQWWLTDLQTASNSYSSYSAIGFGGQYIIVVKELNLVAVFTGGNFETQDPVLEIMTKYVLPAFE